MLQKIQQRLSGWVLWVLVIIISLGFMLWGVENYFQKGNRDKNESLGKVNGMDVHRRDVIRAFNALATQLADQNNNQLPQYIKPILEKQAINSVVTDKVIQTLSKKLGFAYSEDEVTRYLPNFSAFIENGEFSEEKFYRTIPSLGYASAQEFIDNLRYNLISSQIRTGLISTELATQPELEFWIKIAEQKRDFNYLNISSDLFKSEVKATDEEISQYYEKYKKNLKVEEQIKLEYVELMSSDFKELVTIDEESIKDYYEDNKKLFISPQKWRVSHIWLKKNNDKDIKSLAKEIISSAKKGADFSGLAKKYSDDKLTASKGGILHWFTEGSIREEFESAIRDISSVGEISSIVETDEGIEIFKLLETKESYQQPYDEAKKLIREKLTEKKLAIKLREVSEDLADISYANPDSLQEVAKELNLEIKETDYFSKGNTGNIGITKNPRVIEATYHKDVYVEGNNSLPVRIADDHIVVLRIKDKKPERTKSLNEVRDELKLAIEKKLSREKVKQFIEKIVADLQKGNSIKEELEKHKLKWQSAKDVRRNNTEIPRNIINLAFSIEEISKEAKQYPHDAVSSEAFSVIDVRKIVYPDISKMDDDVKQRVYNNITRYYSTIVYGLYIDSLKSQSDINLAKEIQGAI